jgi:hypothetical protein
MSRRIRGSLKWQWRIPAASCFARLHGVANALGDDVSSVGLLAEECQTDANALYRLLRALASIRRDGGDDARPLSADSFWQTPAEGCVSVRLVSRHLLGRAACRRLVPAYRLCSDR